MSRTIGSPPTNLSGNAAVAPTVRTLLIEDNPGDMRLIREMLSETSQNAPVCANTLAHGLQELAAGLFDVLLLDLGLPDSHGLETFLRTQEVAPTLPIVVLTGHGDDRMAMDAVRAGAQDYLVKGEVEARSLLRAIRYAVERKHLLESEYEQRVLAEALVRLSMALSATLDPHKVLDVVCQESVHLYRANAALIFQVHDDALVCYSGYGGDGRELANPPIQLADPNSLTTQALREQRPLVINNLQEALGKGMAALPELTLAQHVGSLLAVPLSKAERMIGVLIVHDSNHTYRYGSRELKIAGVLGSHAAIAIENATLFTDIQRQARQIQQIVDTVPDGVVLLSPSHQILVTNDTGQEYLTALAAMAGTTGLTTLAGQPLRQLLAMQSTLGWSELQSSGTPQRLFEMAARPVKSGATQEGWVLVLRDVTKERERQKYVQAQERLATVGQMAAGIAHDFNNVLTVISLHAEMLRSDLTWTKKQQYLDIILTQTQRASTLVGQVLDFSRRSVLQFTNVDLRALIEEVVKLLERTLPENLRIEVDCDDNPYIVRGDLTRLQQVLMNLSTNARDAMPEGGTLRFGLTKVVFQNEDELPLPTMHPGRWTRLTVSDTGIGIDPVYLPHLFDPFFTTKAPDKGTGLGLAQVYGIVKQLQGEVDVNSTLGTGTDFIIYLPEIEATPPAPSLDYHAPITLGSGTILLVEDQSAVRQAVTDVLELLGYHVIAAQSGEEALERYLEQPEQIKVVVSDMVMPGMSGLGLYEELRHRDPQIKMLILSGYPLQGMASTAISLGRIEWLQKPYTIETLAEKIHMLLESGSDPLADIGGGW